MNTYLKNNSINKLCNHITMITEDLHKTKCRMKYKLCKNIIDKYDVIYNGLQYILSNIQYNNKLKKIKKHFPLNCFHTFDEYAEKHSQCKNVSFSMLYGGIDLQKKMILETVDRRYNMIKVFRNNLKEAIDKNYRLKDYYGIEVIDFMTFKNVILYYNSSDTIIQNFPSFIRKDGSCMFEYVYSVKTENIHHYVDLTNMKFCDRILICGDKNKYNIMFESSNSNLDYKVSSVRIKEYVEDNFNYKSLKVSN